MKISFAVIGDPVEHSRSPQIYAPMFENTGIDADFLRLRVTSAQLPEIRKIVAENRLSGFAVTMPHKRSIMKYLDNIHTIAKKADSVNIVTIKNGIFTGYNTDGDGLVNAILESGASVYGKNAVILGNGGAALGAKEAIERNGGNVTIITREKAKNIDLMTAMLDLEKNQGLISNADILINATPLGMKDYDDFKSLEFLSHMKHGAVVLDMVYRTDGTSLLNKADSLGITSIGGEKMLYHQGLLAFKLWTGYDCSTDNQHSCNKHFPNCSK